MKDQVIPFGFPGRAAFSLGQLAIWYDPNDVCK
jgi:hypothetical protein